MGGKRIPERQQMTQSRSKISKGMAVTSVGIICSRVSGLARDMVFSRLWGTGPVLGAFLLAFTVPNLFRRFFGEGALSEAFVPLFNERLEKGNRAEAFKFLTQILSCLIVVLIALSGIGVGLCFLLGRIVPGELAQLTFRLLPILFPYMIFICIVGFLGGVLNSFNHFTAPAFVPILLNLSLISVSLLLREPLDRINVNPGYSLAIGVVAAGMLQLAAIYPVLRGFGFRFRFDAAFKSPGVRQLWVLVIPAMLAAGVYQVNVLLDRTIAGWLGADAVTSLYYSERLVYLPIGVFAVALSVACLPVMSRAFSAQRHDDMIDALFYSIRHILFLSLPCMLVLMLLGDKAIALIYGGGKFNNASVAATWGALMCYAPGIPAFAAVKIVRSAFYSRKNTKTPMKVAVLCLLLNLTLNLSLMIPLRQRGLALATTISSFVNCGILLIFLYLELKPESSRMRELGLAVVKLIVVLAGTGAAMYLVRSYVPLRLLPGMLQGAVEFFVPGVAGGVAFLALAFACRCRELNELIGILKRKRQSDE